MPGLGDVGSRERQSASELVASYLQRCTQRPVEAASLCEDLLDGVALCKLLARIDGSGVENSDFEEMPRSRAEAEENFKTFLRGAESLMLTDCMDLFQYRDLRLKKTRIVVPIIVALAHELDGPFWYRMKSDVSDDSLNLPISVQLQDYKVENQAQEGNEEPEVEQEAEGDGDGGDDDIIIRKVQITKPQRKREGKLRMRAKNRHMRSASPHSRIVRRSNFNRRSRSFSSSSSSSSSSSESTSLFSSSLSSDSDLFTRSRHRRHTRSKLRPRTRSHSKKSRRKKAAISLLMGLIGLMMMGVTAIATIVTAEILGIVNFHVAEALGILEPEPKLWFFK